MDCNHAQRLIFAERDAPLDLTQQGLLAEHMAHCPSCQHARLKLADSLSSWKQSSVAVETPDPTLAWFKFRRTLRAPRSTWWQRAKRPATLAWVGLPTAAVAAVIFALVPAAPASKPTPTATKFQEVARAEFVDVPNASASTLVYVDNSSGWLVVWADTPGKG